MIFFFQPPAHSCLLHDDWSAWLSLCVRGVSINAWRKRRKVQTNQSFFCKEVKQMWTERENFRWIFRLNFLIENGQRVDFISVSFHVNWIAVSMWEKMYFQLTFGFRKKKKIIFCGANGNRKKQTLKPKSIAKIAVKKLLSHASSCHFISLFWFRFNVLFAFRSFPGNAKRQRKKKTKNCTHNFRSVERQIKQWNPPANNNV